MKIISVVATRPNFIKIAPFIRAIDRKKAQGTAIDHVLVHTGQHYDVKMSDAFFTEFSLPEPDHYLNIGSGSFAEQDGKTMMAFEKVLQQEQPDWVVVVGDVNATMACTIAAKKLNLKVCHIEAGIRSLDRSMPEEINRLLTDSVSDLLLTPDELSVENLRKEGRDESCISFVGNIMIDTLDYMLPQAQTLDLQQVISNNLIAALNEGKALSAENLAVITLHRPSNVDSKEQLGKIIQWLKLKADENTLFLWTIHPRTKAKLRDFGLEAEIAAMQHVLCLDPLSYTELLALNSNAKFVITDSGGLQEECCVLGTPFIVLRENTERATTLKEYGGTGYLAGMDIDEIEAKYQLIQHEKRSPHRPERWDGQTSMRCLEMILKQK